MAHFRYTDAPHANRQDLRNLKRMIPYLWEYRGRVILALLTLVLAKIATVGIVFKPSGFESGWRRTALATLAIALVGWSIVVSHLVSTSALRTLVLVPCAALGTLELVPPAALGTLVLVPSTALGTLILVPSTILRPLVVIATKNALLRSRFFPGTLVGPLFLRVTTTCRPTPASTGSAVSGSWPGTWGSTVARVSIFVARDMARVA